MHSLTLHKASTTMVLVSAGLDGLHPRRGGNPCSRRTARSREGADPPW